MKILLDTHVLLWALKGTNGNGESFPDRIREMLLDSDNDVFYSSINIFEIEIKRVVRPQDGLPSGEEIIEFCSEAGFIPLSLRSEHSLVMKSLKRDELVKDHKDPYDWLLVSQAKHEKMKFLTHDSKLKYYLEDCIEWF